MLACACVQRSAMYVRTVKVHVQKFIVRESVKRIDVPAKTCKDQPFR